MNTAQSGSSSQASGGISARLKLERLKRSWTQEHLAEMARLSVRTVQRLERGEEPSAETLRALALAFEVDVAALRAPALRRQFCAPWSKTVKWMTGVALTLIIGATVIATPTLPWLHYVMTAALLVLVSQSVRGYSVRDGQLWVHHLGWSTRYALGDLTEITINPHAMMGSIRLFGSGGVFGHLGAFRNSILGRYRAFVTDGARSVILRFDRKCIVISPDDPEQFQRAVENKLANSADAAPEQNVPKA